MKKRPNIIFLLSDDQGEWAMGCSGNKEIITPNLDRLAAEGMRFDSFFCASRVCSPARASLLTGRIPSQHGVHDWLRDDNKKQEDIEYLKGQTAYTDITGILYMFRVIAHIAFPLSRKKRCTVCCSC